VRRSPEDLLSVKFFEPIFSETFALSALLTIWPVAAGVAPGRRSPHS
jgi:hypothetical protein